MESGKGRGGCRTEPGMVEVMAARGCKVFAMVGYAYRKRWGFTLAQPYNRTRSMPGKEWLGALPLAGGKW